jgi:hypothetical protein
MKRSGFVSLLAVAAALLCTVVASAQGSRAGRLASERFTGPVTLKHNKADARRDARYLVKLVKLPAGTTQDASYHPKKLRALESVLTDRLHAERFIVPAGASDPYTYVLHHRPGGVKNDGTFGGNDPDSRGLMYDFPPIRGRLFARMLEVTFTPQSDGSTRVLVESQSNWVIPRPKIEKVPSAARQVLISSSFSKTSGSKGFGGATIYGAITKRSKVRRLMKIVDAPPIAQDIISSGCSGWTGNGTSHDVTVTFASKTGRTLATVSASWFDNETVGDWCNPIGFKLGHRSEPGLIDTHMLTEISKTTGDKLK